ncbi:Acg family FMN-binding oxidoreductase [Pseudonocardia sp. CA-142604]|uniref:Acg family FMN-binding oxidoreductase n=1 Tax=Pseudonocardia sp. CA-142604 TaxID=3240024 RepID=UPI003D8B05DD
MSDPDLAGAVTDALRAPSVQNSQPWKWRILRDSVQLYADEDRHLYVTDPEQRELVLSCGAALHHLLVALAARGVGTDVTRLPDPEDCDHIATIAVNRASAPDALTASLYPAIAARQTDRRRMSDDPVSPDQVEALQEHAGHAGGLLVPVTEPHAREQLVATLTEANEQQRNEPGYASELRLWTHRLPGSHDGIPADAVAAPVCGARPTGLRRFGPATLAQPPLSPGRTPDDAAEFLVVATATDTVLDHIRAGEATSAVLLAATRMGLATTPLSQALEIDSCRHRIRTEVLRMPEYPQLVVRVGLPAAGADELPVTPRRALRSVLLPD